MALTSGTKLGPHEILSPLGAGGMGEVYRARDTKLGRDVALKVLPEAFSKDAERMARFQREAQVLASLNHPNIASIYGLEESGSVRALVMELVEGPTLAERIGMSAGVGAVREPPLPLDDTLHIAKQIAEALEAAHEKGIVHRDLKPANVKITPEGAVKVLDFGLAKAVESTVSSGDPSNSPTLTTAATQAGMIMGTAAYMAPEQARGHAVDKRADIWSFGAVLFEMLTGQQAFPGETTSDMLASVLKFDPEWDALPAPTPPSIVRLLRRCLTKDRKLRLQAIGEARIAIEETLSGTADSSTGAYGRSEEARDQRSALQPWRRMLPWALVIALTIAVGSLALWITQRPRVATPGPILAYIPPPPENSFRVFGFGAGPVVVSPDGTRLAFSATGQDGVTRLWVRPLSAADATSVPGTEDASGPFWSGDSHSLAFFANGKLKTVDPDSGSVQILSESCWDRGTWNRGETILFTPRCPGPLDKIPASGGSPQPVTKLQSNEYQHGLPAFLPDGRHFLYVAEDKNSEPSIMSGSLDSSEQKPVLSGASQPTFASGRLLFSRGGKIFAQAFDPADLKLEGEATPVAESDNYSVSGNGVLAYQGGTAKARLEWFDPAGHPLGTMGEVAVYDAPRISPDGKHVLAGILDPKSPDAIDLWSFPAAGGVSTRLTFGPGGKRWTDWSPDGKYIAYSGRSDGKWAIFRKPSDGSGQEEVLYKAGDDIRGGSVVDWSPDGRYLSYDVYSLKSSHMENWILPLFGDRRPFQAAPLGDNQYDGNFSPDGHWLAYFSYESGRPEVYVVPFPDPGGKYQISHTGGWLVRWSKKNQLFFATMGNRLMEADLAINGESLQVKAIRPLFEMSLPNFGAPLFDVSADGQRFLVITADRTAASSITLLLDWTAGLKK
jgi:eukaryotic-like serine/threonine-protein kinase